MKDEINIVWFKRDLRISDHEPLKEAIVSGKPLLLLYIFEEDLINDPHYSSRHWNFVSQCLEEIDQQLYKYNSKVNVLRGDVISIFSDLIESFNIDTVFSYQETGIRVTYARDKKVLDLFINKGIKWNEYQCNGVIRGLKNRDDWSYKWTLFMNKNFDKPELEKLSSIDIRSSVKLDDVIGQSVQDFQIGGEIEANRILDDFINERVQGYSKYISKPQESRSSCSRISPHLAWGSLSVRQVWKKYQNKYNDSNNKFQLRAFRSRLFWHCHFIQKFESEDRIEFENANRAFDSIRTKHDPKLVEAWKKGRTGIPLIDACMRCVNKTGYLNFRMRAMLVSFLTNNLWQHWKYGVHHLARMFLDFEPGIHYAQFQMQAGTFGTNAFRIYDPVKQAYDHDPNAVFIKKWVSELKNIPIEFALEPWKMSDMDKIFLNNELDYIEPIVDIKSTAKNARKELFAVMRTEQAKKEKNRILKKHTKARKT